MVDVVLRAIKSNARNSYVCETGCKALLNIAEGVYLNQKDVCEKGGLPILLNILKNYKENQSICQVCCGAIALALSTQEMLDKHFKSEITKLISECHKKYGTSKQIRHYFDSIMRKPNVNVSNAVSNNLCTKEVFPKCAEDCRSDQSFYCPECCVQQKIFKCLTCESGDKVYCETCWKKYHQGHECEEFFYPARCASHNVNEIGVKSESDY